MRFILPFLLLAGCPRALPDDQPCKEAAWAAAARLEQCTGDADLGESLYETLSNAECKAEALSLVEEGIDPYTFECSLVLRNLACELAVDYGDDPEPWLSSSPWCSSLLVLP